MRILINFEESATVREAFARRGHDAWSCDLEPSRIPSPKHIQGDARDAAYNHGPWDMMIAHPPCDRLTVAGARWLYDPKYPNWEEEQEAALDMVVDMMNAPIERICIENPIGIVSSRVMKPTQIIHPWQHGHGITKATCLWLFNLPPIVPTNIVEGREPAIWKEPPGPNRKKNRSKTFEGIAEAFASQWG